MELIQFPQYFLGNYLNFLSKLFSPSKTITHFLPCPCHRTVSVRLTIHFSHFAFHECFSWNTPWNMKHSLYTFRISCKFRVLLMHQKNKPQKPLTFCTNTDPRAKYCEMKKLKKLAQNIPLYTFCFPHFAYFVISVSPALWYSVIYSF